MDINAVARLSGLTRGQLEQLLSRHGFEVLITPTRRGKARDFSRVDAWLLVMAGLLSRFGLDQPTIRLALTQAADFKRTRPDGSTDDGFDQLLNGEPFHLILQLKDGDWHARLQTAGTLAAWLHKSPGIVLPASKVARDLTREMEGGA